MQDPGIPTHFGAGSGGSLDLFEPVVHDSALPRVVDGVRRRHGYVEESGLPLFGASDSGSAARQFDDWVNGEFGGGRRSAGKALLERSIGGDDDVVCD